MAMRAPRVKGLIWSTMMLLVGLLPVNSLWGAILSISAWLFPAFFSSETTYDWRQNFSKTSWWECLNVCCQVINQTWPQDKTTRGQREVIKYFSSILNQNSSKPAIYLFLSSGLRSEPRSWRAVWCGGVSHPWPILPPWLGETNSPWTILGVDRCDEVAGNDPGALVDQLVEGVLSVCPGLAPDDRTGGVVDLQI